MSESTEPGRFDAIVLAAGRGSRFEGGAKLLADLGGMPLIRRVTGEVAASPVRDIVVVVGADGARIAAAAGPGRWRIVVNADAHEGIASSIRAGMAALPGDADGVLIALGDMPGVTSGLISRVIDGGKRAKNNIVHPISSDNLQGHPVLWPRDLFSDLAALSGDRGAKGLLEKHRDRVTTIPAGRDDAFTDIDTRAALDAFNANAR